MNVLKIVGFCERTKKRGESFLREREERGDDWL